MSFNLRYGTASDGVNCWENRREAVAATITKFAPDLLATQESVKFQTDFLRRRFPQYTCLRRSRHAQADEGESVDVFFRTARFTLRSAEHFWLSNQPGVAGSVGWDARFPRIAACCRWIDHQAGDRSIVLFNTHLDLAGTLSRTKSAMLLRDKIDVVANDHTVIVSGDFNSTEDETPYAIMLGDRTGSFDANPRHDDHRVPLRQRPLVDSWRSVHATRTADEATRHDFTGLSAGPRIDWILHSADMVTTSARIVRSPELNVFPSDHYPVTAVLRPV